ncbi:AMP-binding protein [Ramlibacter sp. AW1]|uniref:AMP-binding protein n=1 Tax=Ramlibacter aurantiacus TaxID=2801330 RepID=A0A936ZTA7_9BURK|nr:AMP-binding protein [Ramlibacter aurantiacus]MBL0420224.1 AMP-binding protein [Ramlibacter aurantiacus]
MAGRPVRDMHASLHAGFRWQVPPRFNIANACCGRWAAQPDAARRIAIRAHDAPPGRESLSYAELQQRANRLSNLLRELGVAAGDRVAIVMPQRFETAVAYMAVLQMGAVAMPLSVLFGPEALQYRLQDSGAVVALCDEASVSAVLAVRAGCPSLRAMVGVGAAALRADLDWEAGLSGKPAAFTPMDTAADDPAVLIYTSGTTGAPKGALIPHRALIGNLPGFVCSQNWFGFDPAVPMRSALPQGSQAVFWSPADWAWTGGLMDALLPTLYFGRPIVASSQRFSPEGAFALMQQHGVTHTFLFPTALKAMMKAVPRVRGRYRLRLQAVMSAGEAVGEAVFGYCREQLGVVVNEMFGQTEINYIVGNCAMNGQATPVSWPARPGSMGRPYPGHRVAVIDEDGRECAPGEVGDVALHRFDVHGQPDPIFFLGYWNNAPATAAKFTADWCRTGDLAVRDAEGFLWYQGRADDVFKSAGYRIGPGEIEDCLLRHPAVANVAVVPKPDRERGALVKAYVVLTADAAAERARGQAAAVDAQLAAQLQEHVKGRLAPYEYPKEVEFIEQLPMTTTGKVQRRVLRLQEEQRAREAAA